MRATVLPARHARTAPRRRGRPPSEELRRATRRRILDAARVAFLENGYHATSVDDIVKASGLSKGGFYFHFPSKEAVFEALYDELVTELYERVMAAVVTEKDVLDRLATGVRAFVKTCHEMRAARLLFGEAGGMNPLLARKREETAERFASLVQVSLDEAVGERLIPRVNTRILARAMVGAFSELGIEVVRSRRPEEVEEVADVLVDVICFMAMSQALSGPAPQGSPG